MSVVFRIGRDAALAVGLSAAVALIFNQVRQAGIDLVASQPYEIFVPCPEPLGEVDAIEPSSEILASAEVKAGRTLVIDAGSTVDYSGWHFPGAMNVPFDYIEPVPDRIIRQIASSRARHVVVYGDGSEPDSGHEMARELAGRGIPGVVWVRGGVQALKAGRAAK